MLKIKNRLAAIGIAMAIAAGPAVVVASPANATFNPDVCIDPRLTFRIIDGWVWGYKATTRFENGCRTYLYLKLRRA